MTGEKPMRRDSPPRRRSDAPVSVVERVADGTVRIDTLRDGFQ